MGRGDLQATEVQAPEENGMLRKGLEATGTLLIILSRVR